MLLTPRKELTRLSNEQRELFAEQGRKNFWFFMTSILGLEQLREQPHKRMADEFQQFTETGNPYALWLWPRETYKSTVFTQCGALWRLIRDPQERILISNAKLDNAQSFLRWIKDQIEGNEFFRWVYGDLVTKRWYTDRIWIKGYNQQAKEPSVMITSTESSVVSQHYTLIIGDDLVNEEWVGTESRVNHTITYFQRLQPLMTWSGQMLFVGTRWADWDLYQYMIDLYKDDPEWWISIRGIEEPDENGVMQSIFPDKEIGYPPERIERLKKTMEFEYWGQFMNSPRSVSTIKLPEPVLFKSLKDVPLGIRYMTVDPATSEKESADEFAIVVTTQTPDDHLYVVDIRHGRWGPSRSLDELFKCFEDWYPVRAVGVETSVAAQKLWLHMIQQEMRRRNVFMRIEELKTGNTLDAKQQRIKALEPYLANEMYHVREDLTPLLRQIEDFPSLLHDDLLDAAAYILQVKRPGAWGKKSRLRGKRTYTPRTKAGI